MATLVIHSAIQRNNDTTINPLEYFAAGVPAGLLLNSSLTDLRELVSSHPHNSGSDTAVEVSLIGLVAYFEAFCKHQFSAIINICPSVIQQLASRRRDVALAANDVISLDEPVKRSLGFLLAEKFDFGTPRSINSLFYDLLGITPLSKDESKKLSKLLNDRNLLVHHSGIYTTNYPDTTFTRRSIEGTVFFDSLVVSKADFLGWLAFINQLSIKLCTVSYKALCDFIDSNDITLDKGQEGAVAFLQHH